VAKGGQTSDPTAEFLGGLARKGHDPLVAKAKGTLRLELVEGKRVERWFVTVDDGDITVSRRNSGADCTLRADKSLFDGMAVGKINATAAVLRGALVVDGDWELMVMLQRLFPGPARRRRAAGSKNRRRRA
jgi:putative sterol carrier protein